MKPETGPIRGMATIRSNIAVEDLWNHADDINLRREELVYRHNRLQYKAYFHQDHIFRTYLHERYEMDRGEQGFQG